MKKIKDVFTYSQVVVVKCIPLNDQWETDCDRTLICLTSQEEALRTYGGKEYEHYAVRNNGQLIRVKECAY